MANGLYDHSMRRRAWSAVMVALIWLSACAADEHRSMLQDGPFLAASPQDLRDLQSLERKQEGLLHACGKTPSCDGLLYTRGLLALFESRDKAKRLFHDLVAATPASGYAAKSRQWLTLLSSGYSSGDSKDDLLGQLVLRDLLARDHFSQQAKLKAQEKRIEELTNQLDMLKEIDHQRRGPSLSPPPDR
jgi:hypothetical protein